MRKKKIFSIDDPMVTLVEVATTLDTTVLEVPWDANFFGRHSDVSLYVHKKSETQTYITTALKNGESQIYFAPYIHE